MTSKRPGHRPSRRPLILRAALEELCQSGADSGELASMRPIADRAGVTPAAMYYHFASKADLLVALIDFVEPDIIALTERADPRRGLEAWIAQLMDDFFAWVRRDPASARFYFITAAAVAAPEVNRGYDASQHRFAERVCESLALIEDERPAVNRWVQGLGVVAVMHEVVSMSLKHSPEVSRAFPAVEKAARSILPSIVA